MLMCSFISEYFEILFFKPLSKPKSWLEFNLNFHIPFSSSVMHFLFDFIMGGERDLYGSVFSLLPISFVISNTIHIFFT